MFFHAQLDEAFELAGEIGAALGVVESQGRQSVEYPVAADEGAVLGFDPDDGGDHVCRYAVLGLGGIEQGLMRPDIGRALVGALVLQKDWSIVRPGERALGGLAHGGHDLRLILGVFEQGARGVDIDVVLALQALEQGLALRALGVVSRLCQGDGAADADDGGQHEWGDRSHHVASNFL